MNTFGERTVESNPCLAEIIKVEDNIFFGGLGFPQIDGEGETWYTCPFIIEDSVPLDAFSGLNLTNYVVSLTHSDKGVGVIIHGTVLGKGRMLEEVSFSLSYKNYGSMLGLELGTDNPFFAMDRPMDDSFYIDFIKRCLNNANDFYNLILSSILPSANPI